MQYTLFSLYRSKIAEILEVSQLALGLVLLKDWDTIFFFLKILQI